MKAVRVTADQDRTLNIAPLPLPAAHRKGEASAERYRPAIEGATAAGQLLQISGRTNRRRKPAVVHRMRSATRHE